ncbi:MAG: hypothetical protein AAGC58_10070 [Asticcacaulis sp.]
MPRPFFQATAEQVISASEAVVALNGESAINAVSEFADLPIALTEKALNLSSDLGLTKFDAVSGKYSIGNPLCKLLRTPQDKEKAAVLRVMIESFEPFLVFREELEATGDTAAAAARTKTRLDLDSHREEIKDTLLSLATFSGALIAGHGSAYTRDLLGVSALLDELALGSRDIAEAIHTVRQELGEEAANLISHDQVINPLSASLRYAAGGNGREAVLHAGNAVDSFLDWFAQDCSANLTGATGVNGKLDKLQQQGKIPKKLLNIGKYLGHVRNAADHGNDADVGAPWQITGATGRNYIFVVTTFVKCMIAYRAGRHEV